MTRIRHTDAAMIGITLGDPSGVGPEIIAAAITGLSDEQRRRLVVFADLPILSRAFAQRCGSRVPDELQVIDRGLLGADKAVPGQPTSDGGVAQVAYLEAAARAALAGDIAGIVTAPISKAQAASAGFKFPGHTEFFADRLRAERVVMMFSGPKLTVALATVHVALADVSDTLDLDGLAATIVMAADAAVRDFGIESPRIGVLGLNPHAGEGGRFGREEIEVITPAIEDARRRLGAAVDIAGPLVPDAAFRDAVSGDFDVLVAMYHDQALIPVKLVDFERAVNVTVGLPVVRTSPDHGVAYDIAGTGQARPDSFQAALALAFELVDRAR